MVRASVGSVRRAVAEHVGSKVKVRSNLGRHKYDVTEGVITETYPCIFLVQVKNAEENSYQTVSYSYKGRTINSVLVERELINGEIRFISSFFVSLEYIL